MIDNLMDSGTRHSAGAGRIPGYLHARGTVLGNDTRVRVTTDEPSVLHRCMH